MFQGLQLLDLFNDVHSESKGPAPDQKCETHRPPWAMALSRLSQQRGSSATGARALTIIGAQGSFLFLQRKRSPVQCFFTWARNKSTLRPGCERSLNEIAELIWSSAVLLARTEDDRIALSESRLGRSRTQKMAHWESTGSTSARESLRNHIA